MLLIKIYGRISRFIYCLQKVQIGKKTILRLYGKVKCGKQICIGDECFIGKGFSMTVFPRHGQTYKEELKGKIEIGNNVSIQDNFKVSSAIEVVIEDDTVIAGNVFITDNNHGMNPESIVPYKNQDITCAKVKIGRGCWIGERCIILPGAKIGEKCIIGAGSVVTGMIPPYSIAVGVPARAIKTWDGKEWTRVEDKRGKEK